MTLKGCYCVMSQELEEFQAVRVLSLSEVKKPERSRTRLEGRRSNSERMRKMLVQVMKMILSTFIRLPNPHRHLPLKFQMKILRPIEMEFPPIKRRVSEFLARICRN